MTCRPVFIVDLDDPVRTDMAALLEAEGYQVRIYEDGGGLAIDLERLPLGPVIADVRMPDPDGLALIGRLSAAGRRAWPVIAIARDADVPLVVKAMRAGARDFIEKPCEPDMLVAAVASVFASTSGDSVVSGLTRRERQVADALVRGLTSKQIALELDISHRTVEVFRARLLRKTGAANTAALAALLAGR